MTKEPSLANMEKLTGELRDSFIESKKLEKQIKENLAGIGFKISL